MYKGKVVRLYPTKEQEVLFKKHINASRFIWNYMLNMQIENYKNGTKYIDGYKMCNKLTELKKHEEYKWLYEVSNGTLQNVCLNLHSTFIGFFKGKNNFPTFKSKKVRSVSFQLAKQTGYVYFVDDNYVFIPKVGKVKYKTDYEVPIGKIKLYNPAISYKNKKWRFSYSMPCENQAVELNDYSMGIDLGANPFAAVAYGDKTINFKGIFKSKKMKKDYSRLKHLDKISHKKMRENGHINSNNHKKVREKSKNLYYKISSRQHDYIHKITRELIELKPKRIVLETLEIVEMSQKEFYNGNNILRNCWGMFKDTLLYKAEEYGIEIVFAPADFPSSQICHCCGYVYKEMKNPNKKRFICPNCGKETQRDINAAINLMNYTTD